MSTPNLPSFQMSTEELRFYDDVRVLSHEDVQSETNHASSVIGVKVGQENETFFRLCHLASMLPSTDGNGKLQSDFGLYTEGAGFLAMLHFNNKIDTIVPDLSKNPRIRNCNLKFTIEFHDTQFSPIEASRALMDDVLFRNHSLSTPRPCALVGATRSAVTGPLSILSATQGLPIISYGSTSHHLSNKDVYKYMGRTVPSNVGDASAVVSYFRDVLGVTHFGILHVRDDYGTAFSSEVTRVSVGSNKTMEVFSVPYDAHASQGSIQDAVDQLKNSGYNYFFGIISTPTYDRVMRVARKRGVIGPGKFWLLAGSASQILGESFSYIAKDEEDLVEATNGVAVISLDINQNEPFDYAWRQLESTEAIKKYFVSKHPKDVDLSAFEFYSTPTYWEYLQYDAVMALAISACEAQEPYFTGPALFDAFTKVSFDGASGEVNLDRKTGTRDFKNLRYKVVNVIANEPSLKGHVSFTTVDVAHQATGGTWEILNNMTFSDGGRRPPRELPAIAGNKNLIPLSVLVIGLVFASLTMCLSMAWAAWTIIHRSCRAVKYSQPHFLILLCLGTFVMSCSVIPMSFQEPRSAKELNLACMCTVWLFQLGFVISFSAISSKTYLVNKLFNENRGYHRVNVKVLRTLAPFLIFLISSVIILLSWTIVAPMKWERFYKASFDSYGRAVDSFGLCDCGDCVIFVALLVGFNFCVVMFVMIENYEAFKRGPVDCNESYYTAISMASVLQSVVIGLPVLLAVQSHPAATFLIRSSLVTIICSSILLPQFIPKEWLRRYFMRQIIPPSSLHKDEILDEQWSEVKRELRITGVRLNSNENGASLGVHKQRGSVVPEPFILDSKTSDGPWVPQLQELCF